MLKEPGDRRDRSLGLVAMLGSLNASRPQLKDLPRQSHSQGRVSLTYINDVRSEGEWNSSLAEMRGLAERQHRGAIRE